MGLHCCRNPLELARHSPAPGSIYLATKQPSLHNSPTSPPTEPLRPFATALRLLTPEQPTAPHTHLVMPAIFARRSFRLRLTGYRTRSPPNIAEKISYTSSLSTDRNPPARDPAFTPRSHHLRDGPRNLIGAGAPPGSISHPGAEISICVPRVCRVVRPIGLGKSGVVIVLLAPG